MSILKFKNLAVGNNKPHLLSVFDWNLKKFKKWKQTHRQVFNKVACNFRKKRHEVVLFLSKIAGRIAQKKLLWYFWRILRTVLKELFYRTSLLE